MYSADKGHLSIDSLVLFKSVFIEALDGLKSIYYNPEAYDVLPFRHKYTQTGEEALTGFFIPAFAQVCSVKRL